MVTIDIAPTAIQASGTRFTLRQDRERVERVARTAPTIASTSPSRAIAA
jgi:hypothetical protein